MAAQERQAGAHLEVSLRDAIPRLAALGFYAVLSLFERLTPDRSRIGEANSSRDELLHLRHDASLVFPASDIASARLVRSADAKEAILEIVTSFLGLTGVVTPLPSYVAEEATGDDVEAERIRGFLDLFHHRLLSLIYRGVAKYRLAFEATSAARDHWSHRALSLSGLEVPQAGSLLAPEQAQGGDLPVEVLLRLTSLLAQWARPVPSLELALEEALRWALESDEVCARLEQLVRSWVEMDEPDRMALGVHNCTLGHHAPLGRHRFVRSGLVRCHLTGLSSRSHARLASGELRKMIATVVHLFARDQVELELALDLQREQRPLLRLGKSASGRLGVDSWLTCFPAARPSRPALSNHAA